jgi:hypothetical protein
MTKCKLCSDVGVIERDGKLYECKCAFLRRISNAMPPYVRKATVNKKHAQHDLINRINQSLFLTVNWEDMKAFLKLLYIKYPTKFIKLTSDLDIIDVYLGKRSKSSRTDDFVGDIYNSVYDLMFNPDIVIIRLNKLSYKNKAAAGALEEALSHRLDYDKVTWAISDNNNQFNSASFAYSDSVWELLCTGMERMIIPPIIHATISNIDAAPVYMDPESRPAKKQRSIQSKDSVPSKKILSVPDDDSESSPMNIYGSGIAVSRKKRQ